MTCLRRCDHRDESQWFKPGVANAVNFARARNDNISLRNRHRSAVGIVLILAAP